MRGRQSTSEGLSRAALGGRDKVRGLGGADVICGGPGQDTLLGGPGQDKVRQ